MITSKIKSIYRNDNSEINYFNYNLKKKKLNMKYIYSDVG